jgi:DNA polymerase-3 subunit delta
VDYQTFLKSLKQGVVPPVLLFHGTEPFLLVEAVRQLTDALFPDPSFIPLNREVIETKEVGAEQIVNSAKTAPCFSERRLIIVRGAQALPSKGREPVQAYLRSPNPTTCLVFVADELLAGTHWLMSMIPSSCVVESRGLTGSSLMTWLRNYAKTSGMDCADEALALLVECVGEDLTTLASEMEKVLLSAQGARRIGAPAVRMVVGEHRARSIFELTRAMERRDLGQGLFILDRLLTSGEEPLGILAMLTREVRSLWQAKEWRRQGKSAEEIARLLRRPLRVIEGVLGRAEATDPQALCRSLERCWIVEQSLKSGGHARSEMSLLFADLCR